MAWQHNESTGQACYVGELRADLGGLRRCEVLRLRLSELRFGNRRLPSGICRRQPIQVISKMAIT